MSKVTVPQVVSAGMTSGVLSTSKSVSTPTGALTAGVIKTVVFDGGVVMHSTDYVLQVIDPNSESGAVVGVDLLRATPGAETTSFDIRTTIDIAAGLTVIATGG